LYLHFNREIIDNLIVCEYNDYSDSDSDSGSVNSDSVSVKYDSSSASNSFNSEQIKDLSINLPKNIINNKVRDHNIVDNIFKFLHDDKPIIYRMIAK
jgi:hypothetical protein